MAQDRLISALARVAEIAASIKQERDRAAATLKVLQKIPETVEEFTRQAAKYKKLLKDPKNLQDQRVAEVAEQLLSSLEACLEVSRGSFLRDFRDHSKQRGIEAHLQDSVFLALGMRVIPDLSRGRCEVRFGDEVAKERLPLDPAICVEALVQQSKRLIEQRDAPEKVLSNLFDAYQATCGVRRISPGEYVPIIDVLNQMVLLHQPPAFRRDPAAARFSDYSRADFSADLYLLQSSRMLESNGKRLHLQTAVIDTAGKPARSISVPSEDGRSMTYYQGLAFKPSRGDR